MYWDKHNSDFLSHNYNYFLLFWVYTVSHTSEEIVRYTVNSQLYIYNLAIVRYTLVILRKKSELEDINLQFWRKNDRIARCTVSETQNCEMY